MSDALYIGANGFKRQEADDEDDRGFTSNCDSRPERLCGVDVTHIMDLRGTM